MMQELAAVAGKSSPVKKSIAQLASAAPVRQRDCAPQIQTGSLPVWLGLKQFVLLGVNAEVMVLDLGC